jgi:hypothetical protein
MSCAEVCCDLWYGPLLSDSLAVARLGQQKARQRDTYGIQAQFICPIDHELNAFIVST